MARLCRAVSKRMMPDEPTPEDRMELREAYDAATALLEHALITDCAAGWLLPEDAPKDGTPILGDFGWPWANYAVWDTYDEQWCIATVQASPMADGPNNYWLECDTEKRASLKRWMHPPSLPNA